MTSLRSMAGELFVVGFFTGVLFTVVALEAREDDPKSVVCETSDTDPRK